MSKRRSLRRQFKGTATIESLETRQLLSSTVNGWNYVLPTDTPNTLPSLVSGSTTSYSLRELVQYYNESYDEPEPFVITLAADATYTLSETSSSSSIWGGRLYNNNEYGALDISPNYSSTAGPLEIVGQEVAGQPNAVITCDIVDGQDGEEAPLDRLFHVLKGTLELQNVQLYRGLALDNGTASQGTDAAGGGVLIDPGATLNVTSCTFKSNAASGTASSDRDGSYSAAGGGIYASAGSNLNISGATVFTGNRLVAGHGASGVKAGLAGGSAYGAGLAMSAPVTGDSAGSNATNLTITATSSGMATFTDNRINSEVTYQGGIRTVGGTGGTGSTAGGDGGGAYGGGLYMGSGTLTSPSLLTIDGDSSADQIAFTDNQINGGKGYNGTSASNSGDGGPASGAGAYLEPGMVVVTSSTTSSGILTFTGNTQSTFTPDKMTASTGVAFPAVGTSSPWDLAIAIGAVNPLVSSGMTITLTMAPSLTGSPTVYSGGVSVVGTGAGMLSIVGVGPSSTIISGKSLNSSVFTFNDAHVQLSNLTIEDGDTTGSGGGILSTSSDVTISSASVLNNSSEPGDGGGIYQAGGTLKLNSVTFKSNQAGTGGKTTTASGAHTDGDGGGIYQSGGTLRLNNVTLQANTASWAGGAVFAQSAALVLTSGTITGNTASKDGGGIYQVGGTLQLNKGTIANNQAGGNGGGVFAQDSTGSFSDTTIHANSAGSGAGIWVADGGTFTMQGGTVSQNTAASEGGGIGVSAATCTVKSAAVSSNKVTSSSGDGGGGIYQAAGTIKIINTTIKANAAYVGGGVAANGSGAKASLTITGGSISGNTAASDGGGIWASTNSHGCSVTASNANVSGNQSTGTSAMGGGIYQIGGVLTIKASSIIAGNSASQGGGILYNGGLFTLNDSTIKGNTATIDGAGFASNKDIGTMNFSNGAKVSSNTINTSGAGYGAGIYVSGGTLNATGLTVYNNVIRAAAGDTATIRGAGIYAADATVNINAGSSSAVTTLRTNSLIGVSDEPAHGAALCLDSNAKLEQHGSLVVEGNTITGTDIGVGAGIAFLTNTSYSSQSSPTFTNNSAPAGGDNYAFMVTNLDDTNYTSTENGATDINYFTDGSGSLRSAISYCENWMSGNANDQSMAILLSSGSYSVTAGQIVVNVAAGESLTLTLTDSTSGTYIKGNSISRIFEIGNNSGSTGSLLLQDIQIQGGNVENDGGGINLAGGTLTLSGVTVTDNEAGPTGVAQPNYSSGNSNPNGGANGADGGDGASGYGGGIYMSGGTLNLLSNTSITGNTVYGQSGGDGQKGGAGSINTTWAGDCNKGVNGGNGGDGGNGGNAKGGGLYIDGGTLNIPEGDSSIIANNTATPGQGGAAGAGGAQGHSSRGWHSENGNTGSPGAEGAAQSNLSNAGGNTAFMTSQSSSAAQVVFGGLYASSGTLNAGSGGNSAIPASTSVNVSRLSGVTVELYASDGTLVATAITNSQGIYHFATNFSGMGYIQVQGIPIFDRAPSGTSVGPGQTSAIDASSGRSAVVQFVDGVAVNQALDIVFSQIPTAFRAGANAAILSRGDGGSVVWRVRVSPTSYKAGFDVTKFDINGDQTPDYILLTKAGAPRLFFVDGRTGAVTRIAGKVGCALRRGMVIEEARFASGDDEQLLLAPNRHRSGRVSVVDVQAKRVLWTSRQWVRGGMNVVLDGSSLAGREGRSDVGLNSIRYPNAMKVLNGQTGRKEKYKKEKTTPSVPSVRTAVRPSVHVDYRSSIAAGGHSGLGKLHPVSFGHKSVSMIARSLPVNAQGRG